MLKNRRFDAQDSSSSSNPRAGWTWHDGKQHSPWLQWNLPVDVTGNDPRQSGDERDEIKACWEAGLLDPSEGETEEPPRVGRWRPQKEPDEPQTADEEEKVKEYKPQEKDRLAAVPRAGALQEVVPSHQEQSGAQGMEAREENDASDDEWKAKPNKLTQKLPRARCRQLGHWKDNHSCLVEVKRVNWADGASRLVGEPGTVSGLF